MKSPGVIARAFLRQDLDHLPAYSVNSCFSLLLFLELLFAQISFQMATEISLHAVTSDHTGLLFIGTSKKRVYEFLVSSLNTRPKRISSYIDFTELCRNKSVTEVECKSGLFYVHHVLSNNKIRADGSLFE